MIRNQRSSSILVGELISLFNIESTHMQLIQMFIGLKLTSARSCLERARRNHTALFDTQEILGSVP
jgi:hypothetical protein